MGQSNLLLIRYWLAMILIGVKFHIFLGAFPFLFQHQQFSRICLHFSRAFWSTKMEVGSQLIRNHSEFPRPAHQLISLSKTRLQGFSEHLENVYKSFSKNPIGWATCTKSYCRGFCTALRPCGAGSTPGWGNILAEVFTSGMI